MKAIVLTLCMVAVAVTCYPRNGKHRSRREDIFNRESVRTCMSEMGIKREDLKPMRQNDDPNLYCLKSCAMIKEEIMDEAGNIDSDKFVEVSVEMGQRIKPDLNVEEYEAALRSCVEKVKEVEDKCMKAKSVITCTYEYWKTNMKKSEKSSSPVGQEE